MLKNKIYTYFINEIFKSFLIILFALTIVAWTVRSVNFLDLIVDDGHSLKVYGMYSLLNITNVLAKFIPLSFLLAFTITIFKLERQNELIILWTSGLSKIRLINVFFTFSIFILLIQLFFSVFITPNSLNKSRHMLRDSNISATSIMIKVNQFSDTLKATTFYVEKIDKEGMLKNIFIRDEASLFSDLTSSNSGSTNLSIFAKRGFMQDKSLILFDGVIQSQNAKKIIEYINFSTTELNLVNLNSRTIKNPKIQETSTVDLIKCLNNNKSIKNCPPDKIKQEVLQNLSRRIGMPFYIPVVCLMCCFMFVTNQNKDRWYRKYSIFFQGFCLLVLAEILVRYAGVTLLNTIIYFAAPFLLIIILYSLLIVKINYEKLK